MTFDFLGKDSMRYLNTVELDQRAYDNLKSFTVGKKAKEEIFSDLSTSLLNEHLKSLMPDLTAKVRLVDTRRAAFIWRRVGLAQHSAAAVSHCECGLSFPFVN